MAADIFTKSFSNPCSWDAACWLVNVCEEAQIEELCALGDAPPPTSQGGVKRGIWSVNSDGSGTWTRHDSKATRCRSLQKAGPSRHEVGLRETFDAESNELLHTLTDYANAKCLDQELPSPRPRAVRTVFHFNRTTSTIPPDAVVTGSSTSMEPACSEVLVRARKCRPSLAARRARARKRERQEL